MRNAAILFGIVLLAVAATAGAHCDTINGPVVAAGIQALDQGDITPALHWIKPEFESELRATFAVVVAARASGGETKEKAGRLFLETLVRLHRAGEGEPFEGIKPAGTGVTPAIAAADQALDKGELEPLRTLLASAQSDGLAARYKAVAEAKKHMNESVGAGRAYVAAYTEFVHYVESMEAAAAGAQHDEANPMKH